VCAHGPVQSDTANFSSQGKQSEQAAAYDARLPMTIYLEK